MTGTLREVWGWEAEGELDAREYRDLLCEALEEVCTRESLKVVSLESVMERAGLEDQGFCMEVLQESVGVEVSQEDGCWMVRSF